MPGFLYFIPKGVSVTSASYENSALAELLERRKPQKRDITRGGPDGGRGLLIGLPNKTEVIALDLEAQAWQKAPGGEYWIGYHKGARPGPEELAREVMQGFYYPTLGDGRPWRIPTTRLYPSGSPLPKVRGLDPDGQVIKRVAPEYEDLYLVGDQVWDSITEREPISEDQEYAICVTALSTNYRLTAAEVSILGLLSDEAVKLIFIALVDRTSWPDALETLQGGGGDG